MESAVSKAEKRMGRPVIPLLLEEAVALTDQKMKVKGLPDWYRELLLEDEIIEAHFRAAINGRYA